MPKAAKAAKAAQEQEPIGIIISRGPTIQRPPRFSAYVYATADDSETEAGDEKVA